jgi:Holliday junction DNA helicase RuvA
MIASLSGKLSSKTPQEAIINVQGVGYQVFIALSTYFALPGPEDPVTLLVSTHWRNDSIQLFGFATSEEKTIFILLTSITGIGPKLALSALSTFSVKDLCMAIESSDVETLASIPGIGKKSASRIILELKEKIGRTFFPYVTASAQTSRGPSDFLQEEATSALMNLGYRMPEVRKALSQANAKIGPVYVLEDLIRTGLKELAKCVERRP